MYVTHPRKPVVWTGRVAPRRIPPTIGQLAARILAGAR
jgi:hypothetical protein